MRIFLDNIEPKMLSKKFKVLQLYYRRSKTIMELVSNSGVYHIENNKFYKLKPVDKSIKKLEENINFELEELEKLTCFYPCLIKFDGNLNFLKYNQKFLNKKPQKNLEF